MQHLENCITFKYVAVDTEGYAPNILGISTAYPSNKGMYFPIGHREDVNIDEEVRQLLFHMLTTVPYRIFHHAGHDIVAIPELHNLPFVCTMVMGHMVDENLMSKGLDYMYKYYCDRDGGKQMDPVMKAIKDTMGWEYVPYGLMYNYGSVDAGITMELFLELLPRYEAQFGPLWSS